MRDARRGVVVEDEILKDDLGQVGRVAAPAIVLESPAECTLAERWTAPDRVRVDRCDLPRDAQMPQHDVGVRPIHRRPRLETTVQARR